MLRVFEVFSGILEIIALVLELWEISRVTLANSQTQMLPSFSKTLKIREREWEFSRFEGLIDRPKFLVRNLKWANKHSYKSRSCKTAGFLVNGQKKLSLKYSFSYVDIYLCLVKSLAILYRFVISRQSNPIYIRLIYHGYDTYFL